MSADRIASAISLALLFTSLWLGAGWPLLALALDQLLRVFAGPRHSPGGWLAGRACSNDAPRCAAGLGPAEIRFANFIALLGVVGAWLTESIFARPVVAAAIIALLTVKELIHTAAGRDLAALAHVRLSRRPWFLKLAGNAILNRIDQALMSFVGAPFRSRRSRVRLTLFASSILFSLLLVFVGVKLYARSLGIRTDVWYSDAHLFAPDARIGYVNRSGLKAYNYLNVLEQTNERGFKRSKPTPQEKTPGVTRIICIGDSVTWGVGVDEREAFPGLLEERLNRAGRAEVINAGVIGMSSYQELLLFKEKILPLDPDIVLINLCVNDLLPSNDPFNHVRQIHVSYLRGIRAAEAAGLSPDDLAGIDRLIEMFNAPRVWEAAQKKSSPAMNDLAIRLLIERPYREMGALARERGFRFVPLLIPSEVRDPVFTEYATRLKRIFGENDIEYLDFTEILATENQASFDAGSNSFSIKLPFRWTDLENIKLLRLYEWKHRERKFIDRTHLTRLGNRIVADEIHGFLTHSGR